MTNLDLVALQAEGTKCDRLAMTALADYYEETGDDKQTSAWRFCANLPGSGWERITWALLEPFGFMFLTSGRRVGNSTYVDPMKGLSEILRVGLAGREYQWCNEGSKIVKHAGWYQVSFCKYRQFSTMQGHADQLLLTVVKSTVLTACRTVLTA